tara:strand:- start:1153 stop:1281 length:129 start_codon:yes stop_codon:yes gene_type:complete
MSETFFQELNMLKPDFNLSIFGAGRGRNIGRIMEKNKEPLIY